MSDFLHSVSLALGRCSLGVIPLALCAAFLLRALRFRPATRHCVWMTVLLWALLSPLLPTRTETTDRWLAETIRSSPMVEPANGLPKAGRLAQAPDREATSEEPTPRTVETSTIAQVPTRLPRDKAALQKQPESLSFRSKARPAPVTPESLAQAGGTGGRSEGTKPTDYRQATTAKVSEHAEPSVVTSGEVKNTLETATAQPGGDRHDVEPQSRFDRFLTGAARKESSAGEAESQSHFDRFLTGAARKESSADAAQEENSAGEVESQSRFDRCLTGAARKESSTRASKERTGEKDPLSTVRQNKSAPRSIEAPKLWPHVQALWSWMFELVARLGLVISGLPAMPMEAWTAGFVLLAGAKGVQRMRSRAILKRAVPADAAVVAEVRVAARRLGLRQHPQVLMVDAIVSPLVWCGRRLRLILPARLWSELDAAGRQAVLCHELAHVRRRDHWMLWADQAAACLYWWHPIVWWVRRRVRDEAENCCDAWVTFLLPQGRRAYAEALLRTNGFLHDARGAAPAGGMGVISGRAGRFARRIQMVMTETSKPRLSGAGIGLALMLALGGWIATPAQSCPPADGDQNRHDGAKGCADGCKSAHGSGGRVPAIGESGSSGLGGGHVMLAGSRGDRGADDKDLEKRLDRLEKDLDRLSGQLRKISDHLVHMDRRLEDAGEGDEPQRMRRPAPAPEATWEVPTPPPPPGSVEAMAPAFPAPPPMGVVIVEDGAIVVRSYHLPAGKLEALTELMSRSDVPIRVRALADRIEVQATERNQAIFKGFVDLISDKKQVRAYRVSPEKLEDLSELMVRSDVPLLVETGREKIKVHGSSLEQSVFAAFLEMIDPGVSAREASVPDEARVPRELRAPKSPLAPRPPRAAHASGEARAGRGAVAVAGPCAGNPGRCREMEERLSQAIREAQDKARAGMRRLEEAQQRLRDRTREHRRDQDRRSSQRAAGNDDEDEESADLDVGSAAVERLSEVVSVDKINQMIGLLAEIDVRATLEAGGAQRAELEGQVRQLLGQAEQLENQGRRVDEQASTLDERGDEVEARADAVMEQLEALHADREAAEDARGAPSAQDSSDMDLQRQMERLQAEARTIAEQHEDLEGAAESLYMQAEALQEAAQALSDIFSEDDDRNSSDPDES